MIIICLYRWTRSFFFFSVFSFSSFSIFWIFFVFFFDNRLFKKASTRFHHQTIIFIQNTKHTQRMQSILLIFRFQNEQKDWMCFLWLRIVKYIKREKSVLRIFDDFLPGTHSYMYLLLPLYVWWMTPTFFFASFYFHSLLYCFFGLWFLMFQHQSYLFNGFCANKHISLYHVSRLNNERTRNIMIEIIAYGVFDGRFSLTKCQHLHKSIENWFRFYFHRSSASSRIIQLFLVLRTIWPFCI